MSGASNVKDDTGADIRLGIAAKLVPNPLIVTTADLRAVRYCFAGVRPWFARHRFDWQAFLDSGIDADRLRATGDGLIDPVIAAARLRTALGASATSDSALANTSTAKAASHGR